MLWLSDTFCFLSVEPNVRFLEACAQVADAEAYALWVGKRRLGRSSTIRCLFEPEAAQPLPPHVGHVAAQTVFQIADMINAKSR